MTLEYIIYADESIDKGKFYSNFYGGALVSSKELAFVIQALQTEKETQNLYSEIKWSKVTAQYLDKYKTMMDTFFTMVELNKVKIRIMFTQNRYVPQGLTRQQQATKYHLLYYQFIKHAFGLAYIPSTNQGVRLRIYLDKMPDTKEANTQFKAYLSGLQQSPPFRRAKIAIPLDQIAEIDSHNHVVLQCLDVVLGAMQFRLNNLHLEKLEGTRRRGKRTLAKEQLYKHILGRIRKIYPNFNVGITTGQQGNKANRWHHPYRHWLFIPANAQIDATQTKAHKK